MILSTTLPRESVIFAVKIRESRYKHCQVIHFTLEATLIAILFIKQTQYCMDKIQDTRIQNTRKPAASVSKKDIFEIIVLTFLVALWAFIGF